MKCQECLFRIFWLVLCVLAVAVWGDYVLSRNPTVIRSIHNAHYIIYLPDITYQHPQRIFSQVKIDSSKGALG